MLLVLGVYQLLYGSHHLLGRCHLSIVLRDKVHLAVDFVITQQVIVSYMADALIPQALIRPTNVLGDGLAVLLRDGHQRADHHICLRIKGRKTFLLELHLDAEMLPTRDAHNVVAWLPGTDPNCDTYYTFIAHYDHLGYMGADQVFPGANDNGSGSAMVVTLAKYFSKNRPRHGIQFILVDAEEENLLGSFFYCENPRLPLDKLEYLIDLDMVADDTDHLSTQITPGGEAGLEQFRAINADGKYPPFDFVMEEMNDDSDHFSFAQKGVPGIYLETEGNIIQYYHTPRDNFQNTRDSNFDRLFHLITEFVK